MHRILGVFFIQCLIINVKFSREICNRYLWCFYLLIAILLTPLARAKLFYAVISIYVQGNLDATNYILMDRLFEKFEVLRNV